MNEDSLWPAHYPQIGKDSIRLELTRILREGHKAIGLNGLNGVDGEAISKAVAIFPRAKELPGVIVFEIESGSSRGIHACEAIGRGKTELEPHPGWRSGVIKEADGRKTTIYYAPADIEGGATIPGIYELRNIRPDKYELKFLNKDMTGAEDLIKRLGTDKPQEKPYYSGIWKTWYPRDSRYVDIAPVDMIWSERYQPQSASANLPVTEYQGADKNPEQIRHNPRYYFGPYGRSGFAIHTDRWSDAETAADPKMATKNELRSFLFRDTNGCVKVRPDCLMLINTFIDEQSAQGRRVLLDVREVKL